MTLEVERWYAIATIESAGKQCLNSESLKTEKCYFEKKRQRIGIYSFQYIHFSYFDYLRDATSYEHLRMISQ